MNTKKLFSVKNIAKMAILSAVATVLMAFDFPIPFLPPFYKIDLSEVVVMIGGFAMGPLAGAVIEFLKIALRLFIKPSETAFIGEISAFLMGISFIVPASYIYQKDKTQKGAMRGMLISIVIATVVAAILNYTVILDMYGMFMGLSIETIVSICQNILPIFSSKLNIVIFGCISFNLIKWIIVTIITRLLYKHVSGILHK